jgi:hypothetical protein
MRVSKSITPSLRSPSHFGIHAGAMHGDTQPSMTSYMIVWEPVQTTICVIYKKKRGGDDPPGPWFRHRPWARRAQALRAARA